jgi:hypothetical protein
MKIKSISFTRHTVFGDLNLDFCNSEGNPYNTIYLVGENGLGKTRLLEEVFGLGNDFLFKMARFGRGGKKAVFGFLVEDGDRELLNSELGRGVGDSATEIVLDKDGMTAFVKNGSGKVLSSLAGDVGEKIQKLFSILFLNSEDFREPPDVSPYLSGYSTQFKTQASWDMQKSMVSRIEGIQRKDDIDLARVVKEYPNRIVDKSAIDKSTRRFKSFIESLFPSKRYAGFGGKEQVNQQTICFEDRCGEVDFGGLSLGEKNVIFQAMFLLENKKPNILLLDEPEEGLHVSWQGKIVDSYRSLVGPANPQVFAATHSVYVFKKRISQKNVGLFIFSRGDDGKIVVRDVKKGGWGVLPWSPSWNEVNYHAYNLPTIEFHDELYGYIQEVNKKYKESEIEAYFNKEGLARCKKWTRENKGVPQPEIDVTLQTFIRNKVHHPENVTMQKHGYTEWELRTSIDQMIGLLK